MGPGGGVQEYCLRWNNHHSTLVSVMDALLQKGTLVDVTLAAEGKSIQVHRLVLCACSNYFQELLSQHWDKQAVVFLKDVKFDQLQALVDYMYRGEVNVSQDQLAAFLNTAEALKIKGLADGDRDRKNEKRILEKANRSSSPSTVSRLAKRPRKVSKDGSMIQTPATATEKPQIPLLPSLVRIPHITSNDDSNDGGEESPESLDNDCHSNDNDMTENLHVELEDGEQFSMVEPKIEAEHEEVEYSGASGDEEDWSDSEYPSRMDASQGEQAWNDELSGNQEGHMTPGNSHLDNSDANNSARGIVDTWHVPEAARTKSRKKVLPNQLGRYYDNIRNILQKEKQQQSILAKNSKTSFKSYSVHPSTTSSSVMIISRSASLRRNRISVISRPPKSRRREPLERKQWGGRDDECRRINS